MTVNIRNLESVLATAQNAALSDDDILYYSKIINQLKSGAVFTVATFADLPLPTSVENGNFYLVENEGSVYIPNKARNTWRLLSLETFNTAWGWGMGSKGVHGDGTTLARSSPVSTIGGFVTWCQMAKSTCHTLAVKTDGTLWSWGADTNGTLGTNTVNQSTLSPVSVVGGFTDWCQVSAINLSSFGVRSNGTLWAWGAGGSGQLGDNTTIHRSSPVSVVGGFTDWCHVTSSQYTGTAMAIRTNGSIWGWGANFCGSLGNGTTTGNSSPVSVVGGFTWSKVDMGENHVLAIRNDCTLWTWGSGGWGQLGDNTNVDKSSPVSVVGNYTDWCNISAGFCFSSAIRTNGSLWMWGRGSYGKLGVNSTSNFSSPVSITGGFTDWCCVKLGGGQTLALRTNGTLWAWGRNISGQLGDGTTIFRSSPIQVLGGFTDWATIAAGGDESGGIRISI